MPRLFPSAEREFSLPQASVASKAQELVEGLRRLDQLANRSSAATLEQRIAACEEQISALGGLAAVLAEKFNSRAVRQPRLIRRVLAALAADIANPGSGIMLDHLPLMKQLPARYGCSDSTLSRALAVLRAAHKLAADLTDPNSAITLDQVQLSPAWLQHYACPPNVLRWAIDLLSGRA